MVMVTASDRWQVAHPLGAAQGRQGGPNRTELWLWIWSWNGYGYGHLWYWAHTMEFYVLCLICR